MFDVFFWVLVLVVLLIDTVDVDFCNNDMLCNADVARMLIYIYVLC